MNTAQLTPDLLDDQAARLHDTDVWQRILTDWKVTDREATGWGTTAPDHEPLALERPCPTQEAGRPVPETCRTRPASRHTASGVTSSPPETEPLTPQVPCPQAAPPHEAQPAHPAADWRTLLSVPVGHLVEESLRTLPAQPVRERRLPGRIGALLPDHLHAWRRIGQPDVRPSAHLAHARQILTEWGWQNTPYRLRNARGARCLCGAMLTAHRLGYGSLRTVDRAGAWVITELRSQGWTDLIGPWNRHPGRTAEDALSLIDATIRRASLAGE